MKTENCVFRICDGGQCLEVEVIGESATLRSTCMPGVVANMSAQHWYDWANQAAAHGHADLAQLLGNETYGRLVEIFDPHEVEEFTTAAATSRLRKVTA